MNDISGGRGLAVVWLTAFLAVAGTVAATPGTPVSGELAACTVEPRSPAAIATLLAGPAIATPAATTGGATLPPGDPVDQSTRHEIAETVRLWLACENAGEPLRAWALFTDGYLYRLLSRQAGTTEDTLRNLATPAPAQSATAGLREVRGERLLPDGRLGATVVITYQSVPMPKTFFFYFVRDGDRLLIDSILGEISFSVP